MEEVDRIIIHSLKDIGCGIEDGTESLEQFPTHLIVEAAVKCLDVISPGLELPTILPQNMVAKFQVGASIANACKNLGYNGDVGYQTFLYSNVVEVRRVFMFLVERLPRESEKQVVELDDPLSKLKADIGRAVKFSLLKREEPENIKNVPFISVPLESGVALPGVSKGSSPQAWREFCINQLPFLTQQTKAEYLLPSVITLNAKGLTDVIKSKETNSNNVPSNVYPKAKPRNRINQNNTWLSLQENFVFQKSTTPPIPAPRSNQPVPSEEVKHEETEEAKQEREKMEIDNLKCKLEELTCSIKATKSILTNVNKECSEKESSLKELAKEYKFHRKAIELLPKYEDNLKKLEDINAIAKQRIMTSATQWETHRKPLVQKYRALKMKCATRESESEKQIETIKDLKGKLESLKRQYEAKQKIRAKLLEDYEQLPKNIKRSAYTRRIMEIIGNIKKQNDEIEKILKDTKMMQKDTNILTERLDRLFTVVDESIFRSAKESKDEHSKKAYKHLATLHTDCGDIVKMVQETGAIIREISDLEEQIEVESSKNIGSNLQRISADLQQLKSENSSLFQQLNK